MSTGIEWTVDRTKTRILIERLVDAEVDRMLHRFQIGTLLPEQTRHNLQELYELRVWSREMLPEEGGRPWADVEKDDTRGRALSQHMQAAVDGGKAK